MPLFHSKKDRLQKEKSKSSFDLLNNASKTPSSEMKPLGSKSRSILNLFSSTDHTSETVTSPLSKNHKSKSRSLFHLNDTTKEKSKSSVNLTDKNNNSSGSSNGHKLKIFSPNFRKSSTGSCSSEDGSVKSNKNRNKQLNNSNNKSTSQKKCALGGSTDSIEGTFEKRISDIAQLDNYIEYLRKSDDCNNVNFSARMCCAQFLRLGLMQRQQIHANNALHSKYQDRSTNINSQRLKNSAVDSTPSTDRQLSKPEDCLDQPMVKFNPSRESRIRQLDNQEPTLDNRCPSLVEPTILSSAGDQSSSSSSPETHRGEHHFVRKGSNRRFKRSHPGLSGQLSSHSNDSVALSNDNTLNEDDESGNHEEARDTRMTSSAHSLTNSLSNLGLSRESLQDVDNVMFTTTHNTCRHPLTVSKCFKDIEIY